MKKRLSIAMAAILVSCGVVAALAKDPPPTVRADFSGWPVEMNAVLRDLAKSTGCKVEIEKEYAPGWSPEVPYGCSLLVHGDSETKRSKAGPAAAEVIRKALEGKGHRVLSTESKSCKADYQFVYAGSSPQRMISLKALGVGKGMQLIIGLENTGADHDGEKAEAEGN